MTAGDPHLPDDAAQRLGDLEGRLDPAHPERAGVQVLAYGEVSCALLVPGLDGWVAKRMSGLRDDAACAAYLSLLDDYLADLRSTGVQPAPTSPIPVRRRGRGPVVYLLQPRLPVDGLGATLLRVADDVALERAIDSVLGLVAALALADRDRPAGDRVAADAQLSNWWFAGGDPETTPVLLDVGTPFVLRGGAHALDLEIFLSAVPVGLRAYYRRKGDVGAYIDDYFVPRLVALDLLGNFHKEGRPDRVPLGVAVVNRWLAQHAGQFDDTAPVTVEEVAEYYRQDASQLALFLRVRRLDRLLRTTVLRRRYDFVLPGAIDR